MSLLAIDHVTRRFGGLVAVRDVSFTVEPGVIFSLIGPNGAGKSTLFKIIAGFLAPSAGRIIYHGEMIMGLKPHVIARKGVVRTFQETTVFKEMSALENVVVGHHLRSAASDLGIFFGSPSARADADRFRLKAAEILDYLGLDHVKHEPARNLPHGHLRALGIALALAAEPEDSTAG